MLGRHTGLKVGFSSMSYEYNVSNDEYYSILRYDAVYVYILPEYQRNLSPPFLRRPKARLFCQERYLLTLLITYLLNHLLTHSLTYVLTYLLTYLLTPSSRVLEKLTGLQLVKKFPTFMEPEVSLPHICPPPLPILSQLNPDQPLHFTFWRSVLIFSTGNGCLTDRA
jgi:hypothetical protein